VLWDILIAIGIGAIAAATSYLGIRVATRPPYLEGKKRFYEAAFVLLGLSAVVLVVTQTVRNIQSQKALESQVNKIEKNTETPPVIHFTPPPINIPPPQVVTLSPHKIPQRALSEEFDNMSNEQLAAQALAFVDKMRTFLNDRAQEESELSRKSPSFKDGSKPTPEENQAWHNWAMAQKNMYDKEASDFDAEFQVDAVRLRDAMLNRLPFGSKGDHYVTYDIGAHPTHFDTEAIAADLQRLANELKKAK
jgi:hypothetical protein